MPALLIYPETDKADLARKRGFGCLGFLEHQQIWHAEPESSAKVNQPPELFADLYNHGRTTQRS